MSRLIWSGSETFTSAGADEFELIPIRVPHRGEVRGYSLASADGTATGNFTADLYTSNQATPPNNTLPEAAFKILSFTHAAPAAQSISIAYVNRDGTPTNPQRFLYLKLKRAGGSKNFVFTISVDMPRVG